MKEKVMNGLEKFSKAMLSPLSYISAAGLILVLGALLTSTSLSAMIPLSLIHISEPTRRS